MFLILHFQEMSFQAEKTRAYTTQTQNEWRISIKEDILMV